MHRKEKRHQIMQATEKLLRDHCFHEASAHDLSLGAAIGGIRAGVPAEVLTAHPRDVRRTRARDRAGCDWGAETRLLPVGLFLRGVAGEQRTAAGKEVTA